MPPKARVGASGQGAGAPGGSAAATKIREEELVKQVDSAYFGTYVFDVRDLVADSTSSNPSRRNRILDIAHVNRLKESFKVGLRRTAHTERLDVIVNNATALSLRIRAFLARNPTTAPDVPPSDEALREFERNLRMRVLAPNMTVAVKPPRDATLRLVNGQHRVAALIQLVEENTAKSNTKPADSEYYWPADVYVAESLDEDAMTFLETNKNPPKKEDSNGYVAVRLLGRYLELAPNQKEQKSSPKEFCEWVQEIFQLDVTKQSCRIMPIIRHPVFRETFYQFCSTRYGEKFFTWTLAQKIVGSLLDEIWLGQFRAFHTFCTRIFGIHASTISVEDWQKIFELNPGRPDTHLRLLFFPEKADYWNADKGEVKRNTWPLATDVDFPKLKSPHEFKNKVYQHRRPLFLSRLTDAEYISVFSNLRDHRALYCPTWAILARLEDHVSSRVKAILQHVMSWVQKSWKPPSTAHNDRKEGKWSKWIYRAFFENATLIEGGTLPYDEEEATPEFLQQRALKFLEELWDQVESDTMWRDAKVSKEQLPFAQLPGWTDFDRDDVPNDISGQTYVHVSRYMERFKLDCWARVIHKVIQFAGPCLDGWMSRFNDPRYLEEFIRPFNPFGALTTAANYEKNRLVSKIPCLREQQFKTSLQEFGDVAGALWFYISVKQVIKNTLSYGFKYNSRRHKTNRPTQHVIEDKDTFAEAKNLLKSYSIILSQSGYVNDPDDWNEDLDALRLVHSSEKRPKQPLPKRAGVMSEEPQDFVLPEDLTQEGYNQAKATLGRDALLATPSSQTPPSKRPLVEDEDTHARILEAQRKRQMTHAGQESPTPRGAASGSRRPSRREVSPTPGGAPSGSRRAPSAPPGQPPTDGPADPPPVTPPRRERNAISANELQALLGDAHSTVLSSTRH